MKSIPRRVFVGLAVGAFWAVALLYAFSDEIHQYFVLGRNCSIRDVLIDSIGVISFYIFVKIKKGCLCLTK